MLDPDKTLLTTFEQRLLTKQLNTDVNRLSLDMIGLKTPLDNEKRVFTISQAEMHDAERFL